MADDEIILADLSDDELVLQMHDDLYDGLKEEIEEGVGVLLERGWTPYDVLTKALVAGMTIVGADFRDGILFVPEVLLAANAMKGGMAILKPLLAETGVLDPGTVRRALVRRMADLGMLDDETAARDAAHESRPKFANMGSSAVSARKRFR